MQVRRPFCLFSLIFVLSVMGCVYGGETFGKRVSEDETTQDRYPDDGEQIVLTGRVIQKEYRVRHGEKVPVIYLGSLKDKNDRQVMLYMTEMGDRRELPYVGEIVRVSGKVSLFRGATNPGEFDLKEYYQILNVSYKLNRTEILERSESCFQLKEKLFQIKCRCCEVLERIYPQEEASLLKAILLGDKAGLEDEIKELYQLNGLIHILSISGLHISLLGMAVSGVLKKCRLPIWLRAPVAAGVMWCYGMMTGMGVSTWRAIFMFTLHLTAELLGRTYDMLTALSLAAVLMLTEQPLLVKHSGFLLSFGAVLGIGVVLPWWKEVLGRFAQAERRKRRRKIEGSAGEGGKAGKGGERKEEEQAGTSCGIRTIKLTKIVIDGLSLGIAIAITTLPVLFYFYYQYSVYSLLLNLYVIPLMTHSKITPE